MVGVTNGSHYGLAAITGPIRSTTLTSIWLVAPVLQLNIHFPFARTTMRSLVLYPKRTQAKREREKGPGSGTGTASIGVLLQCFATVLAAMGKQFAISLEREPNCPHAQFVWGHVKPRRWRSFGILSVSGQFPNFTIACQISVPHEYIQIGPFFNFIINKLFIGARGRIIDCIDRTAKQRSN